MRTMDEDVKSSVYKFDYLLSIMMANSVAYCEVRQGDHEQSRKHIIVRERNGLGRTHFCTRGFAWREAGFDKQ